MPYEELMPLMTAVEEAAQHLDRSRMREILQAAVTEYEGSAVKDLLWDTSDSVEPGTASDGPANLH
jgi:hypothetical protein